MAKQISSGKCNLCGGIFSKADMTKHLKTCKERNSVGEKSSGRGAGNAKSFHLIAEGRYAPDYWLHLEVPPNAKLATLDDFLRNIWLECCGHMSAFTIKGTTYSVAPSAELDDESMDVKLNDVLKPGMEFFHEYDFGSTTHLTLKVVSEQESKSKGKTIELLARNEPPPIPCQACGKMATQVCTECLCSDEGWLCDGCAEEHECGEEMLLPVVNSPRVGTCGYTG